METDPTIQQAIALAVKEIYTAIADINKTDWWVVLAQSVGNIAAAAVAAYIAYKLAIHKQRKREQALAADAEEIVKLLCDEICECVDRLQGVERGIGSISKAPTIYWKLSNQNLIENLKDRELLSKVSTIYNWINLYNQEVEPNPNKAKAFAEQYTLKIEKIYKEILNKYNLPLQNKCKQYKDTLG